MKICIVVSDYYKDVSSDLLKGTTNELSKNGYKKITIKFVSGAFEIPNIISKNIDKFQAFIALGCIIKGQTDHYFSIRRCHKRVNDLSIQSKNLQPLGC